VSIHDAIRAVVLMIENRGRSVNQIFNVGNRNNEVTMRELAELMREAYAECSGDAAYLKHSASGRTAVGVRSPAAVI
jgi:UDP-apiose/xylose synthase